jgi:hypothetical protein
LIKFYIFNQTLFTPQGLLWVGTWFLKAWFSMGRCVMCIYYVHHIPKVWQQD